MSEQLLPAESDAHLVRMARQDIHAFAPLYERHWEAILRYCFSRLGNWDDAADAAQQTFVNALAALPRFQDANDSFRGWLFCIARNVVSDRLRQRQRRLEHSFADVDWLADLDRSPEELAILADDVAQLTMVLRTLPTEQRRCCELRFSGLTHGETAIVLGKSEAAVRASFCRGLAKLRDQMIDAGSAR